MKNNFVFENLTRPLKKYGKPGQTPTCWKSGGARNPG
jgi:hypothetical protein